jgi:hypothetical protein
MWFLCFNMYVIQVFKDGLRVTSERGKTSERYFSDKETRELFTLSPVGKPPNSHLHMITICVKSS